jgi:hypothetical protein
VTRPSNTRTIKASERSHKVLERVRPLAVDSHTDSKKFVSVDGAGKLVVVDVIAAMGAAASSTPKSPNSIVSYKKPPAIRLRPMGALGDLRRAERRRTVKDRRESARTRAVLFSARVLGVVAGWGFRL